MFGVLNMCVRYCAFRVFGMCGMFSIVVCCGLCHGWHVLHLCIYGICGMLTIVCASGVLVCLAFVYIWYVWYLWYG